MASGKSLIGRKLAKILNYEFIDLDDYISNKENLSVSDIFSDKGEIYFRKLEHESLKEIISNKERFVLSLGGGTPCYANNMQLLLKEPKVETIYLQVSIPNLVERLLNELEKRPVVSHIKSKEELFEFVGKHLFERLTFYTQAVHKVNANLKEAEVIESILLQLF